LTSACCCCCCCCCSAQGPTSLALECATVATVLHSQASGVVNRGTSMLVQKSK
jgi:hypothetical protein